MKTIKSKFGPLMALMTILVLLGVAVYNSSAVVVSNVRDNLALWQDGTKDLSSDWTVAANSITLTLGTLTAEHLTSTDDANVGGDFDAVGTITGGTVTDGTFTTTAGAVTGVASLVVDTMTLDANSIVSTDGTIYLGDDNLSTTGTFVAEDVNSTDDAVVADDLQTGDLGVGKAPAANRNIDVQAEAADAYMLYLDHGTNDVNSSNTVISDGVYVDLDASGSGSGDDFRYRGVHARVTLTGTDTSTHDDDRIKGGYFNVEDGRTAQLSSAGPISEIYAIKGVATVTGNVPEAAADGTYSWVGVAGEFLVSPTPAEVNDSGSTLTASTYGIRVKNETSFIETAGTLNQNVYGAHVTASASNAGTSNLYGIYVDMVQMDGNYGDNDYGVYIAGGSDWAIYSTSSADSSLNGDLRIGSNTAPTVALDVTGDTNLDGKVSLTTEAELTISGGVITATQSNHDVDTQNDDAADDLDTINGGTAGMILVLTAENNGRTVTVKDGTGNIQCGGDRALDNTEDTMTLIYDGSEWLELAFANNGA
jgi:hypothetical protein